MTLTLDHLRRYAELGEVVEPLYVIRRDEPTVGARAVL